MATVIDCGKPNTLVLDLVEVEEIAEAGSRKAQEAALTSLKHEHGLPAHAPVAAANEGEWLQGDSIFVRGRRLPADGGWYVTRRFKNGLRTARHSTIG